MKTSRDALILIALGSVLGLAVLTIPSCGDDEGAPELPDDIIGPQLDTIPPAAVTDLRLRSPTHQTLALVWTAPGDDGDEGTAAKYDIRHSKAAITEENWSEAATLDSSIVPTPKPCGQVETVVVLGLDSSTRYYFALKAIDDAANESRMSNCPCERTLDESYPPSDVTDLVATATDETSFELTWTAPGDDWMSGTAAKYDIRYSAWPVNDETTWDAATPVSDPPLPKPAGEAESFTVTELSASSYFFALKTADELDNWSGFSNAAPALGFGELLWPFPPMIHTGEEMYITFAASPYSPTRVSLHEMGYGGMYCGERLVKDLVWETLPEGAHTITFDFFDEDTNRYLPYDLYVVSVCWGPVMKEWTWVSFVE